MKKNIKFSMQGTRADIGDIAIHRLLPNRLAKAIGPFVFLDHWGPIKHSADEPRQENGNGAHPHRGIATLTYVLSGEEEHFDSRGNYGKVRSGGVQWMKAGNGIVHDGNINIDMEKGDLLTHGFQFWINLPSKNKTEAPQHMAVQAPDVPQQMFDLGRGWIKVVVGEFETLTSKIPSYTQQFIYHIHLEPGKLFSLATESNLEYAAFLPLDHAIINDTDYKKGTLIAFDQDDGAIEINNGADHVIDIMLFGGAKYKEPIVFGGPFVMNSELEISEAYRDFHAGKYGEIQFA